MVKHWKVSKYYETDSELFNIPKFWVKCESNCLKTVFKRFTPDKILNFYIAYKMKLWSYHKSGKFLVWNSLFGNVKLTKNSNSEKYSYSSCGITFDIQRTFSLRNGRFSRNVIKVLTNMSSSVHVHNKKNTSKLLVKIKYNV